MTEYAIDHPPLGDSPDIPELYAKAARVILEETGPAKTVLDVGSNIGQWARAFVGCGCRATAIDGEHMRAHVLPGIEFVAHDLREPFDLGPFDLVLCLEVGEHLPEESADTLVASLCAHSGVIVFSAAVPGQRGFKHINCQPIDYWQAKFEAHGYGMDLAIRAKLPEALQVYYRRNMAIFRRRT